MNENNRNYRIDPELGVIVLNYCAAQLPKITVEIKSGRTTYRFTGRYDGERSPSGKLLDRMAQAIIRKRIKKSGRRVQDVEISYNYIGILPATLLFDLKNGKTA